jgi:hypothetical protein
MARDVTTRLSRLEGRRKGTDRLDRLALDERIDILAKRYDRERWQTRASDGQPNTRYALGSMQEVGETYTRKSMETATRVGNQLLSGLTAAGHSVEFRLQGSVPLNVHIRGVSDVDLLNLDTNFLTYNSTGTGTYVPAAASKTSYSIISALRTASESVLKSRFPAATVDTSGAKAIKISGGSLARSVDVVPCHWHDTIEYQKMRNERDRAVTLLDRKLARTFDNLPFLHIAHIHSRDREAAAGCLKKAIRLCKNVKADAEEEGRSVALSSFDIAAVMYHADMAALREGQFFELAILTETQRWLDYLYRNQALASTLRVPDLTRQIFDSPEKLNGLLLLSVEMDDLAREVAKENSTCLRMEPSPSLEASRDAIARLFIQ